MPAKIHSSIFSRVYRYAADDMATLFNTRMEGRLTNVPVHDEKNSWERLREKSYIAVIIATVLK